MIGDGRTNRMRLTLSPRGGVVLSLSLLLALLWVLASRPASAPRTLAATMRAPVPQTPFEEALLAARNWRSQAMLDADRDREAATTWDPRWAADDNPMARRQEWLSASRRSLHRAREAARRAAALA